MSILKIENLATKSMIVCLGLPLSSLIAGEGGYRGGGYGGGGSISATAEREIIRRQERVANAEEGEIRGDKLVTEEDFESGITEYKTSLDTLPRAPLTQGLRDRITQKYGDASVKLARQRATEGRYDDSVDLLESVLNPNVDPDNPEALALLEDLKDPEKYSPAMTPEHYKKVQNVERLLKIGWSEYNLGKFDHATKTYMKILQEDRYNKAARRKLTVVEDAKSEYYRAAYNHTRSKMLSAVEALWEIPVPPAGLGKSPIGSGGSDGDSSGIGYLASKLRDIEIPKISFNDATLEEAIEFLRVQSIELDTLEDDPKKKGINIVVQKGASPIDEEAQPKININLTGAPLGEALRYITEMAGLKYKIEPYSVVVVPISDVSEELYSKVFKVPPNFLALASGDAPDDGDDGGDPFGDDDDGGGGGGLVKRLGAKEILEQQGVSFPEGSSAFFNGNTSQLVSRNTQRNMELIEAYVASLIVGVPKQVFITTKFVEVTQNNLDELGFDWLLGAFNIPSSDRVFSSGGSAGNSPNTFGSTDFPFTPPVADARPIGSNPLTAGLRSGANAIKGNAVDSLLNASIQTASNLSPGIFGLAGVFTDPQFQVVIRALKQRRGADLLSAPSVTTRSGQAAKIEIIREFIYPSEYDPPEIPGQFGGGGGGGGRGGLGGAVGGGANVQSFPVTPSTPSAFETRNLGVTLEVEPIIGADGFSIDLNLNPEVVEFEGFINYGSPIQTSGTNSFGQPVQVTLTDNRIEMPIFSTRRVRTAVSIWDGQTVAIGGLIREDIQHVEDRVPLLGDLPFLGRLFRTEAEQHLKRNLMIFVSAKLMDPAGRNILELTPDSSGSPDDDFSSMGGPDSSLFGGE